MGGISMYKGGSGGKSLCLKLDFCVNIDTYVLTWKTCWKYEDCLPMDWLFDSLDWIDEKWNEMSSWVDEQIAKLMAFLGFPTLNFFVTWDWFETICITDGLSTVGKNYDAGALEAAGLQSDDRFKSNVWRLDSTGVTLGYPKGDLYASTNPWVCMLPGMSHWDVAVSLGELDDAADAGIEATSGFDSLPKWDGDIKQILLNTGYIWEVYLQSETINEFVMKVAEGVNDACGGFWDLKLVEDPLDPSRLMVVDMKAVNELTTIPVLDLGTVSGDYSLGGDEGVHGRSIARSWGMKTDIDDSLKHSIMMGSNGKDGTGQNTNESVKVWKMYGGSVTDRIYKDLSPSCECAEESKASNNKDCKGGDVEEKSPSDIEGDLGKAMEELSDDITDESIDTANSALRTYYSGANEQAAAVPDKQTVIPIGFECTFDGIGSLYWGESFAVKQIVDNNLLPKGHRFMIVDIAHSIDRTDWTTSIETSMILATGKSTPRYSGGASGGTSGGSKKSTHSPKTNKTKNPALRQPIANKLRECMDDLGSNIIEKGVEIDNGGDISTCLRDYACSFFTYISKNYPELTIRVTGANDAFHHKLSYTSSHTSGDGLDFVVTPWSKDAQNKINKALGGFHKAAPSKYHWIDEYARMTAKASGKHFHMRCGVDARVEKSVGHGKKAIADSGVQKINVTPMA